jgi:hypothetical protein
MSLRFIRATVTAQILTRAKPAIRSCIAEMRALGLLRKRRSLARTINDWRPLWNAKLNFAVSEYQ